MFHKNLELSSLEMNPHASEDLNIAFSPADAFKGTVNLERHPNGQLARRDILIEILAAYDPGTKDYQLLKQINMNLTQFVDSGKLDDVISF